MADGHPTTPTTPVTPLFNTECQQHLMHYLHKLSGQKKENTLLDLDHSYAKAWNKHPDPNIKSRPAKFLFMKNFPRQQSRREYFENQIDVDGIDESNPDSNPFVGEVNSLIPRMTFNSPLTQATTVIGPDEAHLYHEKAPVDKRNWTHTMQKLWARSIKILQSDRLSRLVCEGQGNEVIVKRNLIEKAASRFRQAFASIAGWDASQLSWLHSTLHSHLTPIYLTTYHEAMQLLRQKLPSLVDKFYVPMKAFDGSLNARSKQLQTDPIQSVLNNYRPVSKLVV